MKGYPEYAHLGFKFLCAFWGFQNITYMYASMDYRQKKYDLLKASFELQKQQLKLK